MWNFTWDRRRIPRANVQRVLESLECFLFTGPLMEVKIVLVSILSFNFAIQRSVRSTLRTSERSSVSNATPTSSIRTLSTTGCPMNTLTVSSVICLCYKSILESPGAWGGSCSSATQRPEITGVWASVGETKKQEKKDCPRRKEQCRVRQRSFSQA